MTKVFFSISFISSWVFASYRHEIAGIVKEVGSNVQRFKTGDPVGVGTYINSCRNCDECNEGLEVQCPNGMVPTINAVDVDGTITKGGYSSFIVVHERLRACQKYQYLFFSSVNLMILPC